jgi:hypothetical protein
MNRRILSAKLIALPLGQSGALPVAGVTTTIITVTTSPVRPVVFA